MPAPRQTSSSDGKIARVVLKFRNITGNPARTRRRRPVVFAHTKKPVPRRSKEQKEQRNEPSPDSGYASDLASNHYGKILIQASRRQRPGVSSSRRRLDSQPSHRTISTHRTGTALSLSPQSILCEGQSDPFHSYAIDVTAEVNRLVTYYKEKELFKRYHVDARSWSSDPSALQDWRDSVSSLEDEGTARAFMARYSHFAAVGMSNTALDHRALVHRSNSTASLRRRLRKGEDPLTSSIMIWHIHMLHGAEVLAGNFPAAHAHGTILKHFFDQELASGRPIDQKLLIYILYNDVHMAAMFLVRPCFDPEHWLSHVFQGLLDQMELSVPALATASSRSIDPQVIDPRIRPVFVSWTKVRLMRALTNASGTLLRTPETTHWVRINSFISQGRLVNHYLDVQQRITDKQVRGVDSLDSFIARNSLAHLHASAFLSLACLFLIRTSASPNILSDLPYIDALKLILTKLRLHLDISQGLIGEDQKDPYSRARLWALFAGALAERQRAAIGRLSPEKTTGAEETQTGEASQGWFNVRFARQAMKLKLFTWSSVREVLESFLYADHFSPHPVSWWNSTIDSQAAEETSKTEKGHSTLKI